MANGKKVGKIVIGHAGSVGRLGAISLNSEFGTINATGFELLTSTSSLLFDINGTNQDVINIAGDMDMTSRKLNIEFTSLANIQQDAEYKLVSFETLSNGDINSFTTKFLEGYDGELFLKDNALWVKFTTVLPSAVPEPAEWAMIFGGIALGLAVYRRRK